MYRIINGTAEAEIEVKKSRFLAAVVRCRDEEEARGFLERIRKQHYDARHHCFALRIGEPQKVLERSSDDGEPQGTAGKPMLEILKGAELYDVCAVVTRYFGGTLLGTGGLMRAYSDALKAALSAADCRELREGVRICVRCDYAAANRIKYLAQQKKLSAEREEYTDRCLLSYLLPKEEAETFAAQIRELSAGKAETKLCGKVLYSGGKKPEIYRVLEAASMGKEEAAGD